MIMTASPKTGPCCDVTTVSEMCVFSMQPLRHHQELIKSTSQGYLIKGFYKPIKGNGLIAHSKHKALQSLRFVISVTPSEMTRLSTLARRTRKTAALSLSSLCLHRCDAGASSFVLFTV
jgi:hypothetical protein